MEHAYQTISSLTLAEYRNKGSKFIAYAQAVYTEEEVQLLLDMVKREHPKATHHCYAYRLGMDKQVNYRSNDDGEPSGTAGRPILGQIDSKALSNIMVVVVRYFGGTKLGVSGLISAYKRAARAALDTAEVVTEQVMQVFDIQFDYLQMNEVMTVLKRMPVETLHQEFYNDCNMRLRIAEEFGDELIAQLTQVEGLLINKNEVGE